MTFYHKATGRLQDEINAPRFCEYSHTFWGYPRSLPLLSCLPLQQFIHFLSLTIWSPSFFHLCFEVIQDVDDSTLEGQYQSFASLMEQRLAELFVLAGQQGTRFRRAAAVGSYTVQVRD